MIKNGYLKILRMKCTTVNILSKPFYSKGKPSIVIFSTFLLLLLIPFFAYSQNGIKTFDQIIKHIQALPLKEQQQTMDEFVEQREQIPIIEGNTVIFLAKGVGEYEPKIYADFNTKVYSDFSKSDEIGKMINIPGTSWYYLRVDLLPTARIEYKLSMNNTSGPDPLNPNVIFSLEEFRSELIMPEYVESEPIINSNSLKGQLFKFDFESKIMNEKRTVQVYLPYNYNSVESFPTAYYHDGNFYVEARIPQLLDALIDKEMIRPIIAVFDNPNDRTAEYVDGKVQDYRNYIIKELVPYIKSHYKTIRNQDQIAIIGSSRGGASSIALSFTNSEFGLCAAFSPAINLSDYSKFKHLIKSSKVSQKKIFIVKGLYDIPWRRDSDMLVEYFTKLGIEYQLHKVAGGHNLKTWYNAMDEMLILFFPKKMPIKNN